MNTLEYLRQFRIGEYALFDLSLAVLGMALMAPLLSKLSRKVHFEIPKRSWVFLTLPIGILVHLLVGIITPMTANFLDLHSHYFLKGIIVLSFVLGVKDFKRIARKPTNKTQRY